MARIEWFVISPILMFAVALSNVATLKQNIIKSPGNLQSAHFRVMTPPNKLPLEESPKDNFNDDFFEWLNDEAPNSQIENEVKSVKQQTLILFTY